MHSAIAQDRIVRDLRCSQLAFRLLDYNARTQTICELTGLTRHKLSSLREYWEVEGESRHRGPSPKSFKGFFRSSQMRDEGACLVVLCWFCGVFPPKKGQRAARHQDPLEFGERLCETFEAFKRYFPRSTVEFEQVMLLAQGMEEDGDTAPRGGCCASCGGVMLIDPLEAPRRVCLSCQRERLHHEEDDARAVPPAMVMPATEDEKQGELF